MHGVAEFHKVSFDQFLKDSKATGFTNDEVSPELIKVFYEKIKLPIRATSGSAGYDFFLPYPFFLAEHKEVTIPTGISVDIQPGWCLALFPRSGLAFNRGVRLVNTVGIIDSDYIFAENEGHIIVKLSCEKNMCLQDGDRFVQGIFLPYALTRNDVPSGKERTGGMGSTDEQK